MPPAQEQSTSWRSLHWEVDEQLSSPTLIRARRAMRLASVRIRCRSGMADRVGVVVVTGGSFMAGAGVGVMLGVVPGGGVRVRVVRFGPGRVGAGGRVVIVLARRGGPGIGIV